MMLLRLLPWELWAALVGFSAATYKSLPAAIPRHLDFSGAVTSTVPRTWLAWMLIPIIALATQALLLWLTLYIAKVPELFNFPEAEKFLKLPPAYRGDVIPRMQQTLDAVGVFTMVVMGAVQVLMFFAAKGYALPHASIFLMVSTIVLVPGLMLMTSRVNSAVEVAEKKWRASGSPAR